MKNEKMRAEFDAAWPEIRKAAAGWGWEGAGWTAWQAASAVQATEIARLTGELAQAHAAQVRQELVKPIIAHDRAHDVLMREMGWIDSSQPAADDVPADNDLVLVERGLLGAACYAIRTKKDAPEIIEKLRAITFSRAQPASADDARVPDLSRLVARLMRELKKADLAHELPMKAMDYLKRHDLIGSPLRTIDQVSSSIEMVDPKHLVAAAHVFEGDKMAMQCLDYIHALIDSESRKKATQ